MLVVSQWTKFFYFSHIFNVVAAVAHSCCAYLVEQSERETIGEFNVNVTRTLALTYYISSGFLILSSIVGFLAQKYLNKPSLWISYCILMSILSIVDLALAVNALSKLGNHKAAKNQLLAQMEDYVEEYSPAAERWDRLQMKYKCCGVESYSEWQDVPYGRTTLRTPKSCCLPPNNTDTYCSLNVLPVDDKASTKVYTRGCLNPAIKGLDAQITILGLLGLTVSLIDIAIGSLTCFLVMTKKV